MIFGMGKSNAKVYVQSTAGIKFRDVAGEHWDIQCRWTRETII